MVLYRHRNCGNGIIGVFDSKNQIYVLKPGQECIIDVKKEQSGVKVIEEIQEEKKQDVPETEQIIKTKNKFRRNE
jgi:hypothetical protein